MNTIFAASTALALLLPSASFAQDAAAPENPPMDHAQMDQPMMDHTMMAHPAMAMQTPLPSLAGSVEGSGTARLPLAEGPPPGLHAELGGGWMGMAHGFANFAYTDHGGPRGADMVYLQSMLMVMAEHSTDKTRLQLRAMTSAEPLMDNRGYPNLFATGETYGGGIPLVDRQHPHDLFMELAARFDVSLGGDTSAFLYGGPVGEPALGPSAFMHRGSARLTPEPPISHHWFDSTHIAYGVVTAGLAGSAWQVEGSAFRGREPDEDRWDIETPKLDSWSLRATFNPSPHWALQVSHGRIKSPEATHADEDEARTTASVHYDSGSGFAAMLAFAVKNRLPGHSLTAWLGEVTWDLAENHTVFIRAENVANDEFFPDHDDPLHDQTFRVSKLMGGYAYTMPLGDVAKLSLGGAVSAYAKPATLDATYGRNPVGGTLFARLVLGQ